MIKELYRHSQREKASFHMPGHKNGRAFLETELKSELWKIDTTELVDTDCLQNPTGIIKETEETAARLYGAQQSFLLVNGSTGGILSMFWVAFKRGDRVLVDRNCHKSVVNAMTIVGIEPVYIYGEYEKEHGFYGRITPQTIGKALQKNEEIKGVFITSPTYYGISSDISAISEIVHKYGAFLLTDEAHGAHFPYSERFPESAVKCGADLSVVSLHKSLPCPNQTAILNVGKTFCGVEKVRKAVNMFQTTSPSYIFMASIDFALSFSEKNGKEATERILSLLPKSKYIKSFDDPFKLLLDFTEKGYSGFEISDILIEKFGIFPELADLYNVLLMASWANAEEDFRLLYEAISYLESLAPKGKIEKKEEISLEISIEKKPCDILTEKTEKVSIDCCENRISAQTVTVFPPCIPILLPGEKITRHHIEMINSAKKTKTLILENDDFLEVLTED